MTSTFPLSTADQKRLKTVRQYGDRHLSKISRKSGETYAKHGQDVASVLQEVTADASLLSIAMLHDLLVHPDGKELLKDCPLTDDERTIVESMHKLRKLHIDENTGDLDLVIGSFSEDPRLMLLRMAHRLNDVRHLERFPKKRRKEIAHETLHMYTTIAGRLGFHHWRWQMEDITFVELQPRMARAIQKQFDACEQIDKTCLAQTRSFLLQEFEKRGLKVEIEERIKGIYSAYRKMAIKERRFEELTDRLALRILVDAPDDCYRALGIVHASMHAIPGKLKDYIGMPKENGYRSIHTVVYPLPNVSVIPIEIQIRTHAMHRECEYGVASHAGYKELKYALTNKSARVNLFRNLENLRAIADTPEQFEHALRTYFREEDIVVFDPNNRIHHLRHPATAFDYACLSSGTDPLSVTGVRINGRHQPLGTLLHDGDTVELVMTGTSLKRDEYLRACQQEQTKKMIRELWRKEKGVEKVTTKNT